MQRAFKNACNAADSCFGTDYAADIINIANDCGRVNLPRNAADALVVCAILFCRKRTGVITVFNRAVSLADNAAEAQG